MHEAVTLLYDAECALCRGTVAFARRRGRNVRFLPLQADAARGLLAAHGLPAEKFDSVVLVERDLVFTRSTAVLRLCWWLHPPWPLVAAFIIVPRRWRDSVYRAVARRRNQLGR